jgi:hypothetical protein
LDRMTEDLQKAFAKLSTDVMRTIGN